MEEFRQRQRYVQDTLELCVAKGKKVGREGRPFEGLKRACGIWYFCCKRKELEPREAFSGCQMFGAAVKDLQKAAHSRQKFGGVVGLDEKGDVLSQD